MPTEAQENWREVVNLVCFLVHSSSITGAEIVQAEEEIAVLSHARRSQE